MEYFQGIVGIVFFLGVAWALSENRREIERPLVIKGLVIHFLLTCVLYFAEPVRMFFSAIAQGVRHVQLATQKGTSFLFGYLGGGDLPFDVAGSGSPFIIAFQTLPVILVVGALSALLWHWGILKFIVSKASRAIEKTFNVGGAVGVASAANVFMGMVEAPLLIRPYIPKLNRSELFVVMTAGMATISGTMMVLIGTILEARVPDAFSHILIASVINAPIAITLAKIIVPGRLLPTLEKVELKSEYHGALDAITRGTVDALRLLANIIALLIVFIALIYLFNVILNSVTGLFGLSVTLQEIMGTVLAPVCWLLGIPWEETATAGSLLGTKLITNEFMAYIDLVNLPVGALSDKAQLIMTYALCSFSNLGSLAIMIGGMGAMAPNRLPEIATMGPRAVVSGFLSGLITACVIGLISSV